MSAKLANAPSWSEFVQEVHGRPYLANNIDDINHPAKELLQQYRDSGVPVKTTDEEWTLEQRDECVSRGCHQSANKHKGFIREEMADFAESSFWTILPYEQV